MSGVAQANLVLFGDTAAESFIDLGAQGFGAAPRMLTMQTTGVESGSVTPVDVVHGDAIAGSNKSTTPTLATLGWTSGSNVGIGFNSDQIGGAGITLQSLTLTIYDGTTVVATFNLDPSLVGFNFTADDLSLQQGNGQAVFNFVLDAAQQAAFDALNPSGSFFAGLSSTLGCPAGAPAGCLVSNDGPDSFVGFQQPGTPTVVPEPSALLLAGTALLGVGYSLRHRISRRTRGQLIAS
jgi:hypothetical protein